MVCIARFSGKWCHEESWIQLKWNWAKKEYKSAKSFSDSASAEHCPPMWPRICEVKGRICGKNPCMRSRWCDYLVRICGAGNSTQARICDELSASAETHLRQHVCICRVGNLLSLRICDWRSTFVEPHLRGSFHRCGQRASDLDRNDNSHFLNSKPTNTRPSLLETNIWLIFQFLD